MRQSCWLSALALVTLLAGCATTGGPAGQPAGTEKKSADRPAPAEPVPLNLAKQRHSRFARLKSWRIEGRLGIQQGNEGFSTEMVWRQNGRNFDIQLTDPLGREVARLSGNDKGVQMKTMDGKQARAKRAEDLLEKQLGWSFPVQSLFYWVKGTPDPNYLVWFQEYDDLGRLVSLKQNHWNLKISRYQNLGDEFIPRLIRMTRDGLKVKLLIRNWE